MSGKRTNKRPGRPSLPAREQLSHVIQFRVSAEQLVPITARMDKAGHTNVNEFAREMLLGGKVTVTRLADAPPSKLDAGYIAALNRLGVNLNQIAKQLNSKRYVHFAEIEALIARIDAALDAQKDR